MTRYPFLIVIVITGLVTAAFLLYAFCVPKKEIPSAVVHPEWSRNATIYEVNIRQYTPEGTFAAFEKHLPRLKKMGVEILWLMPVNPIGIKNRKGSLGSYYSVKDYLGVNPEYGTLSDLKSLVKEAHNLGMKVIIDWVANHTSWDNNLITEHPEWYTHDAAGNIVSPVKDWTDAADLDYNQEGLREYMKNALVYWVKEAGVDGFRCDVAGMLPVSFWNWAVPELRKIKPVFMLAEWETPEMHEQAFDMTYSWNLYHLMNQIAKGERTAAGIDSLLAREDTTYPKDAYRMLFTSNHDENSWNGTEYERLGEGAKCFAVLTFTLPGMPLIYTGQEAAFNRRLKFFDKDTVSWDNYPLENFYATLIRMKRENPALWCGKAGGDLLPLKTVHGKQVFAFLRVKDQNRVLAVFNLSPNPITFQVHGKNMTGTFQDVFSGETAQIEDGTAFILGPWGYRVMEGR
ncbi:MAG TPA: alpha-amylase family glycosyl hydrolase [Bacteroidales bacterium]|nr:alpha-amylase family glycosyl hydrolase [Bacteroidales bacterium]